MTATQPPMAAVALAAAAALMGCALIYSYDGFEGPTDSSGPVCPAPDAEPGSVGTIAWSRVFNASSDAGDAGTSPFLYLLDMAVDPNGNTVVLGLFQGTALIEASSFSTAGANFGLLLYKLDSSGRVLWARKIAEGLSPEGNNPFAGGVASDGAGRLVLALSFTGTIEFDEQHTWTNASWSDIFVAGLDGSGSPMWGTQYGDPNSQLITSVAVSADGSIALTGFFNQALHFSESCTPLQGPPGGGGGFNVFVAELGPTGLCRWARGFGEPLATHAGLSVAVDSTGAVAVAGRFQDTLQLDGHGLTARSAVHEGFVARLDAQGKTTFAVALGEKAEAMAVTMDALGAIYVVGGVQNGLYVGEPTGGFGGIDVMAAKFDAQGALVWSRLYGSYQDDFAASLALDPQGNLLVAGQFRDKVTFGNNTLNSKGMTDLFVVKLNDKGEPLVSARFGDDGGQQGRAVRSAACGELVIGGQLQGDIDFGKGALQVDGGQFIARFLP